MNNVLELKDISKTYYTLNGNINVLDGISLKVKQNEFISIIGPSGSGKSTLLNIISGLEDYKGNIVFGKDKPIIGYMFQEDTLFPWLTILDNALLGLKIQKRLNKETKEYTIGLLNKYGLKDFIYKYPNELSGGMKQRVP